MDEPVTGEQTAQGASESAMGKLDALFAGLPEEEQAVLVGLVGAAAAGALERAAQEWVSDDRLPPFLAALRADVVPALFRALESRSLPRLGGEPAAGAPGGELLLDLTVSGD